MKKKIVALTIAASCVFALEGTSAETSAEESNTSSKWTFYGGAGLTGSQTQSDYKMNASIDPGFGMGNSVNAHSTDNEIGRVGGEVFVGAKRKFDNNCFVGAEVSHSFSKATQEKGFPDSEIGEVNEENEIIESVSIKHGNELGLSLKFGKDFEICEVYGILGLSTKKIDLDWNLNSSYGAAFVNPNAPVKANASKRVYGTILGIGAEKKFNNRLSCSTEYRYKTYNAMKSSHDLRAATRAAFINNDHDTSDRNFKNSSSKHELSLRFAVNM